MENNKLIWESIKDTIENSVFCYDKKDGQGFTEKSTCRCYMVGEKVCAAYFEQLEFHRFYTELENQGFSRNQIMKEIEKRFKWDETSWIQYNLTK